MFRWFYKKQKIQDDDFVMIDMHEPYHEKRDVKEVPEVPYVQEVPYVPYVPDVQEVPDVLPEYEKNQIKIIIEPRDPVYTPIIRHREHHEMEQELQQFFNRIIVHLSSCIRELCYTS